MGVNNISDDSLSISCSKQDADLVKSCRCQHQHLKIDLPSLPTRDFNCNNAYKDVRECVRQFKGQTSPCRPQWKKLLDCGVRK